MIALTFLISSAQKIGISDSLAFYLVAVANGVSVFGRLSGGMFAMKIGPLNTIIIYTSLAAATTYAWPLLHDHAAFIIIVCIYGYVLLFFGFPELMSLWETVGHTGLHQALSEAYSCLLSPQWARITISGKGVDYK